MSWRDDLRRVTLADGRRLIGASFRGVPFLVDSGERAGGRRTVPREFPFRDDPYVEDLGRRARRFHVDGYVLGRDYLRQRDGLLAALEDVAGPGELVHPHHGVRRAICSGLTVRETTADGGIAFFALDFEETPAQAVVPSEVADPVGTMDSSADLALLATAAEFEDGYSVLGAPAFALASLEGGLIAATARLGEALGPVVKVTQEAARLKQRIEIVTARASSLVRTPGEVLGAFQDTLGALAETALGAPGDVLAAFVDTYSVDLGTRPPETTATRRRERANFDALGAALRRILAIEAARLAPLAAFLTADDAVAAAGDVAALLEEQEGLAGDLAYPALVRLRADLLRLVPGGVALARVISVSRPVAVPSILLSYQLYGSTSQEADLVARNNPHHPGFMSGTLQALSDE